MAGKAVRRVKVGLDEQWWADSLERCCYLRNVQDLSAEEKTPHEAICGTFPVGQSYVSEKVEYHPISTKDQARLHQFSNKVLSGICVGYALHAGRGSWKGYILVADVEELQENDIKTKEALVP